MFKKKYSTLKSYILEEKNTIFKQNPAYIPRKGAFFEHDLRMDPDADEKQGEGRG